MVSLTKIRIRIMTATFDQDSKPRCITKFTDCIYTNQLYGGMARLRENYVLYFSSRTGRQLYMYWL